jgi:hypothetical protein
VARSASTLIYHIRYSDHVNTSDTTGVVKSPDYGVDAPGVIRNLLIVAVAGFLLWLTMTLGWWSGDLAALGVRLPLGHIAIWPAGTCLLMALWMLWDSKIGKMYAESFAANGCTSKSIGSSVMAVFLAILTMGSLRPATLVVRKTA